MDKRIDNHNNMRMSITDICIHTNHANYAEIYSVIKNYYIF